MMEPVGDWQSQPGRGLQKPGRRPGPAGEVLWDNPLRRHRDPTRGWALGVAVQRLIGCCGSALLSGLFLAVATGCLHPSGPIQPEVSLPDRFQATGATPLPDRWWRSLEDATLSGLIEQALEQQPGLMAVWARLDQAQALARKAGALLWPEVQATARAERTRVQAVRDSGPASRTDTANLFLGLAAGYELDLWGRIRATREAALWEARATREQLQVAALTLSAEMATVWFELAAQRALVGLWERQWTLQSNMLQLVEARFERGQVGAPDVLRQRQILENVRANLDLARARGQVLRHRLVVLAGRSPGEPLPEPGAELGLPPPLPATGVPAELVTRRPDLRAAWDRLQAADRQLAAAVADQFPRLGLSAQASTSGHSSRVLFEQWLAGLAANLTTPVLEGGQRRAEVAYRRAVMAERLHAYRQAVLEALAEVETALVQEQQFRDLWYSLQRQLEYADRTVERLRDSYSKGAVDYLRVLDALLTQQNLQRAELETRRDLWLQRIGLCRALAGGWKLTRPGERVAGREPRCQNGAEREDHSRLSS